MASISINENICKGCELCVKTCPRGVIAVSEKLNAKGYHPAEPKNPELCVGCRSCAMMCPDVAITVER